MGVRESTALWSVNTASTSHPPCCLLQTFKALSSKKGAPKWKTFLDRLHALKGDGTGFIDQLSNNKEGGLFVVQLAAVHTALKQHIVMDHIEVWHGSERGCMVARVLHTNVLAHHLPCRWVCGVGVGWGLVARLAMGRTVLAL